jgi:2-polyprenyl-6-methoxyphenol hydroxylase-like FAD-dependent oxidoreductase
LSSQLIPEKLRRTSDLIRNEIDTIQALQMHYKEFAEQRLKQLKYIVKENEKTAIVIGASMGGLLAARALADHFAQVTLLERDVFPEPGENRKGVPQGKHAHVLWALGRDIMERYLPGLAEELTRLGAVNIADVGSNVRWFDKGGYYQPGASGVAGIGVSRPTLEAAVRKRVLALPNVRTFTGCNVLDLVTTANKERITGVRLVRNGARGSQERMMADLVIDASGRGSRSPAWLEKLGYQRPPEEEVRIGLGYTSRFYRHRPGRWPGLNGIVSMAHPPNKRLGALCDQDGDRWVVTLAGYLGDHAPTDPQGFVEFARSLPTPDIYNVIKEAEPLGEPVAYKFPTTLRRRYEKLAGFPEGYLVIGDALCSFNPTYGQGMTVAALEAVALGEWLTDGHHQSARSFFVTTDRIIETFWQAATGNDLRFPEVEGARTPIVRFLNWYLGKLLSAAHRDNQVSAAFLKVINMIDPPLSILDPRIVWRVVKCQLC